MKSLEEVLLCEAYEPENYGGAAQGKGFYIVADHKQGFGAGGELDVTIASNKISIKEKVKPNNGNHDVYVCFEKAGNYDLDFNIDCDAKVRFGGMCKVGNLKVKTSGKPLESVFLDIKKCEVFDLGDADALRVDLDNLTAIKQFIGPKAKECGFRIAKCNNLVSIDLSNILNTPAANGRLYIRNCKKLSSIDFPQAISMDLQLEKLPVLNDATKSAAQALCDKCSVKFIDMI